MFQQVPDEYGILRKTLLPFGSKLREIAHSHLGSFLGSSMLLNCKVNRVVDLFPAYFGQLIEKCQKYQNISGCLKFS